MLSTDLTLNLSQIHYRLIFFVEFLCMNPSTLTYNGDFRKIAVFHVNIIFAYAFKNILFHPVTP